MPLTGAFQPCELAGISEVADPAAGARRRPPVHFEQVLDLALDVEAPYSLVRPESQGLERNRQFGRPAVRGAGRCGVPNAVPISNEILGVVRDLTVGACAGRIDLEEESVAVIKERI